MELVESTWRVCEGVTLTRWMLSPERESWTVRWTTTGDDRRQRAGVSAAEVLRVAADEAPGRYRDALLAAAADPPSVPDGQAPIVGTWRLAKTDPPPVGHPLVCGWSLRADHTDAEVLCQEEEEVWRHKDTGATDYNRPDWWMLVPPLPAFPEKRPASTKADGGQDAA